MVHLAYPERTKKHHLRELERISDCQLTIMRISTYKNIKVSTKYFNLNDFYSIIDNYTSFKMFCYINFPASDNFLGKTGKCCHSLEKWITICSNMNEPLLKIDSRKHKFILTINDFTNHKYYWYSTIQTNKQHEQKFKFYWRPGTCVPPFSPFNT